MTKLEENCKALGDTFQYRGVRWKGKPSYSNRVDNEKIPTSFETDSLNGIRIYVTCGHRDHKPDWIFHCFELGFDTKQLGPSDNPKEMIDKALTQCHDKLAKLTKELEPTRL